jgi:hypothetical protein
MARIVLAWELGSGLGHLDKLRAVGVELLRRGHTVTAAIRELNHAEEVFAGTGIGFVPAPYKSVRFPNHFDPPRCYAHILHNTCFADGPLLRTLLRCWHALFDLARADIVIAEHAPTAILACRGRAIRVVRLGTGFTCPPLLYPLPALPRQRLNMTQPEIEADEASIADRINGVLRELHMPPLTQLRDLYAAVDMTVLATYSEIDHFGPREHQEYWGIWQNSYGVPPRWPEGAGSRIFAYLKPCKAIEGLLTLLKDSKLPALVVSDGLDPAILEKTSSPALRFETRPVEIRQAAAECDLAILNAGHGSAASMLLAAKPMLLVPVFLEQSLLAQRVEQLGAGRMSPPDDPQRMQRELQTLLGSASFAGRARDFSRKYADYHNSHRLEVLVDRIEGLLK